MGWDSFKDHLGSRWDDCATDNGLLWSLSGDKMESYNSEKETKEKLKFRQYFGDSPMHPLFSRKETFEDHQTGKKYVCRWLTKGWGGGW